MWRPNIQKQEIQRALCSKKDLVILDTETTGCSKNDFIIQFAAKKYRRINNQLFFVEEKNIYIKPPMLISDKIEELTGITNDFLSDKPSEEDVFGEIYHFLDGTIPVIYNAPFDIRFISNMYKRNGKEYVNDIVLDVLDMARDLVSKDVSSSHKLCDIAALYGADKDIPFHNAMGDVIATERLFKFFVMEYFNKEKQDSNKYLKKATVLGVSFWEGHKGNSRIYVNTNRGSVYYDIRNKAWEDKNLKMEEYDMDDIRKQALAFTNTSCEAELAKYR